ncbi:MucR family transcriptional regulator [Marinibaculum pumilum]|uniref:MucR family transcriptional regulator n=1 Tax=Marinibaculum pumilum TaxID=1766165 RepID=A0ABV7KUI4_9PROT
MAENDSEHGPDGKLLDLTSKIVSAYVGNNSIASSGIPDLIRAVHSALETVGNPEESPAQQQKPAVPVKKSIQPDHIICLEDGKKLKMLKRYLRTTYGMSPEEYRTKWGLPPDYPMVAPNYAAQRSKFAKKIGLGKRGRKRPAASAAK